VTAAPSYVLRVLRGTALTAISVIITGADGAAFAESYRGLWVWALHHGLSGFWAAAFPLQVDTFPARRSPHRRRDWQPRERPSCDLAGRGRIAA
jgi:hypothetical protein